MVMPSFLGFFVFAALNIVHAQSNEYKKIQGLGFAIYTGPGQIAANLDPNCEDKSSSTDCNEAGFCVDALCPGTEIAVQGYCFSCYQVTGDDCGCVFDANGELACAYETVVTDGAVECYIGSIDTMKDVVGRAAIMEAAVNRAYELSDKSEDTLKVFNAPEFYWRGRDGAYPMSSFFDSNDEFNAINQIGRYLEPIVQQAKFKDWLFVFGTVIAASPVNSTYYDYLNFAPIYKGFDPSTTDSTGMRFLVPKRYISSIDFLASARTAPGNVPKPVQDNYGTEVWNDISTWLQDEKDYTLVYDNFLVINNITLSVEICLDHLAEEAKNSVEFKLLPSVKTVPAGGDGSLQYTTLNSLAQFSLVTSAGMSLKSTSSVLANDATIFLQDGLRPFPGRMDAALCGHPSAHGFRLNPVCEQVQENDDSAGFYVFGTKEESDAQLKGLFALDSNYPMIRVYDPVTIPGVENRAENSKCELAGAPAPTPTTSASVMNRSSGIGFVGVISFMVMAAAF
jgi:hypothetical protein